MEQNFKQHIGLIERQLEVTQWQVMGFNAELAGDIQAALSERKGKPWRPHRREAPQPTPYPSLMANAM